MDVINQFNESRPRHEYKENMLRAMIAAIVVSCGILFIYFTLAPTGNNTIAMAILGATLVIQASTYALLKRGYPNLATKINLGYLLVAISCGSYLSGGVYSSFTAVYFLLVALSTTMVDARFTRSLLGAVVMIMVALYVIEVSGYLPYAPAKKLDFRMVVLMGTLVITTVILLYHMSKMYKAEAQLVELYTAAERLKVQQQLTADLAHDLRTPVSVLVTTAYLMRKLADKKMDIQPKLDILDRQIQNLSATIEGFLELSSIDAMRDNASRTFSPVEVQPLLMQLHSEYAEYARQRKRITLTVEPMVSTPIVVLAEEIPLRRVLSHLINNAITYGKEDGFVKITCEADPKQVVIKVIDNGIGIAPEHIDKIFDRFYRANLARTSDEKVGTGIGLSIVKRFVELYHGTITVESKLAVGTTFVLTLPTTPALPNPK